MEEEKKFIIEWQQLVDKVESDLISAEIEVEEFIKKEGA